MNNRKELEAINSAAEALITARRELRQINDRNPNQVIQEAIASLGRQIEALESAYEAAV